jgi:N utilization substance protein B
MYQVDAGGLQLDEAIGTMREQVEAAPEVFDYAEVLARGAHREKRRLDKIIRRLSPSWAPPRQPVVDRNLLRLAIYELSMPDAPPPPVVINEAVELAKKYSTEDSGKFINGVLGSYIRELEAQSEDR